jgi:hypothetical protein
MKSRALRQKSDLNLEFPLVARNDWIRGQSGSGV